MKTDRLEFFTDGVFAIAITLLVLEIKIPNHEQVHHAGGLYNYLMHIWPAYLSYIMSFMAIGIYWSNLHHFYTYIVKKTNHTFNLLNILFLMTIAFMPFTTAVFADYVLDAESFGAAVSTFSLGFLLPVPAVLIIFLYAINNKQIIDTRLTDAFLKKQMFKLFMSIGMLTFAFILSFYYPMVSLCMILGSFVLYFLPPDMPEYKDDILE
ncbi:MAG: TMEM175 family protein [Bacteroidia bacterium]